MIQLNVFHTWEKCFKFAFWPLTSWNLGIWEVNLKVITVLTVSFFSLLSKVDSISNTCGDERYCWAESEGLPVTHRWPEGERRTVLGVSGRSIRNSSLWKEMGKGWDRKKEKMPGCGNGNVCRQAFALSHHQNVVPLSLFLWSLQLSRLCKHWHSGLLPAPGERPQGIKGHGEGDASWCGGAHWYSQRLSERVLLASDGKLPGPFSCVDCVTCPKACRRTEHSWDFLRS